MAEEKQDKLPLDARLLSDAIIELNISRRSVGLYPVDHPIVRTSIERAFSHLQKMFELRASITLGIAKDRLVIDDFTLDQKNPVFREFALSLHSKGIAAVTFNIGLTQDELIAWHRILISKDALSVKELIDLASKEIRHIMLIPIDMSSFCFMEGASRAEHECGDIWDDYVFGLLEGRLSEDDAGMIYAIPPERLAEVVNSAVTEDTGDDAYDRVITAYIRKKGESRMSSESLYKFICFVDNLKPEIKRQFLERAGSRIAESQDDIESITKDMTQEAFQKIVDLLTVNSTVIPRTLKNLIDKLSSINRGQPAYFDFVRDNSGIMDDIVLGEEIMRLFSEDNFRIYVTQQYQNELDRMLAFQSVNKSSAGLFRKDLSEEETDRTVVEIMLELLHEDSIESADYLAIITRISEFMNVFVEAGRFGDILNAYNALYSDRLGDRFRNEAAGVIDYFFHSEDYISKVIESFRMWGRMDRENAFMLARALKRSVISPLMDALTDERDTSVRKFFLSMIEFIGSDVLQQAVARLNDTRWYVVRNMIYIIRECNGSREVDKIRKLAKHPNPSVCLEAVRALMHFRTHDSIPYLLTLLQNKTLEIRRGAIRLAGAYRIKEAVPYLIEYLQKKDIFGVESIDRLEIVKSLNEIGDPSSVPALQKLYNSKTIFYKDYMDNLKVEIFRGLKCYPHEAVKDLVHLGLASKNPEIHELCEKYLVDYHADGGNS